MPRLDIPGGEVHFKQDIEYDDFEWVILSSLIEEVPWEEVTMMLYGRMVNQPRLICWMGEKPYSYSGVTFKPQPYTPTVIKLKEITEKTCNMTFNSVLLNYYRDGKDSIGFHADDEKELGESPIIASMSFGDCRTFIFKNSETQIPVKLTSGSLLVMAGDTQKNWKHGINKEANKGPRVNLTFRNIV